MALVKTMKWFGTERRVLLGALVVLWGACGELDPVNVESLCEPPGPVRMECPQCQTEPPWPSECAQCQQSGIDEETCLPPVATEEMPADGSTTPSGGDGGSGANGANGEGGAGAEGAAGDGARAGDGSQPNDGSQAGDGSMGTGGDAAPPSDGAAGADGSAQPGEPGQAPPRGCVQDSDCTAPGYPACRLDGQCAECLRDEHCGDGRQCDTTNRCVPCVNNLGCEAQGKVCKVEARTCVACLSEADCKDPAAPACTSTHECVACTEDKFCPEEAPACDQMSCYECKSDQYCNSPGKHACIEADHVCVECETDAHCRSEAGRPLCLVEENACVQCLSNDDCSDPAAAHCDADSHTCVPCTAHSDCEAFATTAPRCVEGSCVACDQNGGICNGKACILSQNVCSTTDAQSVEACGECITSDECVQGHVCVNVRFGSYNTGDFCLPNLPDFRACPRPFARKVPNVMTLDGFRVQTLCALPEMTTCQALLDTMAAKTCNDNNAACGLGRPVLGSNDGLCPMGVCTYNCASDDFCPNGMVCSEEQKICL